MLALLLRIVRRVGDSLPITWRGLFVALLSSAALYRYGYATLDLLLFVVGISGLVLTALASLTVGISGFFLRRSTKTQPSGLKRLEAGSPIPTGFQVSAYERVPLVRIHWQWTQPDGVECRIRSRNGKLHEEALATKRCLVQQIQRRIDVFDAFGLARVGWSQEDSSPLAILPKVGRLKRMPVLQSMAATEGIAHPAGDPDGDRMEIRRYVPGDSVRHILWKTFAKTRQLNVRVPERSIHPDDKTVAYLLTGDGDEAAAAAARVALESGVLGPNWLFGVDGAPHPVDSLDEALLAIARSGSQAAITATQPSQDLSTFLHHPDIAGERSCIVFAPAKEGAWISSAQQASRGFSGKLSFVLATDGVTQTKPTPLWQRLLYFDAPVDGTLDKELQSVTQTLAEAGFSTIVVDRESGRAHGSERQQFHLGATG